MIRRKIVVSFGIALLIAAAVVVALREQQSVPLPDVPVAQTPAAVRVKAVERNPAAVVATAALAAQTDFLI